MKKHQTTETISPGNREGFTLLEVLVSSAILVLIVIMVATIFQQSSISWDTGIQVAESNMELRGALGVMQAEVSTAVNGRPYGDADAIDVSASSMTFHSLANESLAGEDPHRVITYDYSGGELTRTVKNTGDTEVFATGLNSLQFEALGGQPAELPHWIEITVSIARSRGGGDISAYSYGPNTVEDGPETSAGTETENYDDIYSW